LHAHDRFCEHVFDTDYLQGEESDPIGPRNAVRNQDLFDRKARKPLRCVLGEETMAGGQGNAWVAPPSRSCSMLESMVLPVVIISSTSTGERSRNNTGSPGFTQSSAPL
jgi:hypothetical protein